MFMCRLLCVYACAFAIVAAALPRGVLTISAGSIDPCYIGPRAVIVIVVAFLLSGVETK